MTIEIFVDYMLQGREIEFSLGKEDYFLQPRYDDIAKNQVSLNVRYELYRLNISSSPLLITDACVDELLKFDFGNGMSFLNSFKLFNIKCVL